MTARVTILEALHRDGVARMGRFARVEVRLGLDREATLRAVADSDVIVVRSTTRVDRGLFDAAPRLAVVARAGTGVENIDLEEAACRGIKVVTTPTGNTVSAAEFTIGQMLNLCRKIPAAQAAVGAGDFRRHLYEGRELGALSVGLVGLGNVGMAVARRLRPFGCRLVGWDPEPPLADEFARLGGELMPGYEALIPEVDILSFHVRLTPETRGMLNARALALAKDGLLVVNTARGAVVDPNALLEALSTGRVAAAALDVLDPEPPFDALPGEHDFTSPLLGHPRILNTPHMGASTEDAQRRIALDLAAQVEAALSAPAGAPRVRGVATSG